MKHFAKPNAMLLVVIGLHLGVSFIVPQLYGILRRPPEPLSGLLFGILLSQPVMLCAWSALSVVSLQVRLPAALTIVLVSSYTWAFSASIATLQEFDERYSVQVFFVWLALFVFLQLLCGLARLTFGCRIGHSEQLRKREPRKKRQFSLRQLMLWTVTVAVALGMREWVFQHGISSLYYDDPESFLFRCGLSTILAAFLSLPALCLIGAVLRIGHRGASLMEACVVTVALSMAPFLRLVNWVLDREWSDPGTLISFGSFVMFEIGLCGSVASTMAILGMAGWQLRVPRPGNPVPGTLRIPPDVNP